MDNFVISVSEQHYQLARDLEQSLPPESPPLIIKDKGIDHYGELLQIFVPVSQIALSVIKFYLEKAAEKKNVSSADGATAKEVATQVPPSQEVDSKGEIVITVNNKRIELTELSVEEAVSILESLKTSK
jgi:hypothetical protein